MLVLVGILESVRTVLTKHEVGHILSFLCDRLKDWHTLRPTLTSLKVLLGGRLQRKRRADESEEEEEEEEEYRERQLKQEGEKTTSATTSGKRNRAAALLTPENVKLLATSFFSHVDVQSHSQPIRQLSFEIAELLLSDHLPVLLAFRGERA